MKTDRTESRAEERIARNRREADRKTRRKPRHEPSRHDTDGSRRSFRDILKRRRESSEVRTGRESRREIVDGRRQRALDAGRDFHSELFDTRETSTRLRGEAADRDESSGSPSLDRQMVDDDLRSARRDTEHAAPVAAVDRDEGLSPITQRKGVGDHLAAPDRARVEQLADEIVRRVWVSEDRQARKTMMLDLEIPDRGRVFVRLRRHGDAFDVRLRADDPRFGQALRAHRESLREQARRGGVRFTRLEVV